MKAGTRAIEVLRVRRPNWSSWLLGIAAFGLVGLRASRAAAFDGQLHAGAKGGLAMQQDKDLGWGVGVHGAYGLSDMFDAELELLLTENAVGDDKTSLLAATAGLAYKVDILQWIPYVGLLGGYYSYGGVPGPHGETKAVGAALQIGLDFLLTREVALTFDFRSHFSFKEEFYSPLQTVMLGAEYRWGF